MPSSPSPSSNSQIDILGFGCVAVDDLCYVESYPGVDSKAAVLGSERRFGGLVGTALVAASRLGAKCAYEGALGDDELSVFAANEMRKEGIDLSRVENNPKAGPIHSYIIVGKDHGTRNIFFDYGRMVAPNHPAMFMETVRSARVLLIDHYDIARKIVAVRFAQEFGIPVVADFEGGGEEGFPELLERVDHLILSVDFARKLCGVESPAAIAVALWHDQRKAVVITCGSEGCWFVTGSNPTTPQHFPAFVVRPVGTTGCGDVFHGAYAAALARQLPFEECLRIASAAAALKAASPAGPDAIPCLKKVEHFLKTSSL